MILEVLPRIWFKQVESTVANTKRIIKKNSGVAGPVITFYKQLSSGYLNMNSSRV